MKYFELIFGFCAFCFCILVQIINAQERNIGVLPAFRYVPDCFKSPEEDAQRYLQTCILLSSKKCFLSASVPYIYWLDCIKADEALRQELLFHNVKNCEGEYKKMPGYTLCDKLNYTDPGDIIYRPLFDPDLKTRLYPEIFDAIQNLNQSYVKMYVIGLRKTFTGWFATQYNYRWKNNLGDEDK